MAEHVCIRNVSLDAEVMVALGGEISTQPGTTFELFEKRMKMDYEKNVGLIHRVIRSGHTSILEHLSFSFLMTNVSVCVEEFFIEHRLASFTVKSRRYVDFRKSGYYIPDDFPSDEFKNCYMEDMNLLFKSYDKLIELGVPKEDARFVLPYSFYSNFICTMNAREAIHIMTDLFKEGYMNPLYQGCDNEYMKLYRECMEELKSVIPWLHYIIILNVEKYKSKTGEPKFKQAKDSGSDFGFTDNVDVTVYGGNPSIDHTHSIRKRYGDDEGSWKELLQDSPRELELLNYTISISSVSLATVTHLVRHRMQSIIVPKLYMTGSQKFVLPQTITNNKEARSVYNDTITSHIRYKEKLKSINTDYYLRPWFNQYLLLAGNTIDLVTSMNARELLLFLQLRTCNRAQWEIQSISNKLLKQLRRLNDMFDGYGPSCYVQGSCPEGRMCCGKQEEMKEKYLPERVKNSNLGIGNIEKDTIPSKDVKPKK